MGCSTVVITKSLKSHDSILHHTHSKEMLNIQCIHDGRRRERERERERELQQTKFKSQATHVRFVCEDEIVGLIQTRANKRR